jgi:DNA-binding transcriptional ArsR family regulator
MDVLYNSPQLDSILDALANKRRRGIIHDLSLSPNTVGKLARNQALTLPAMHKHIRILDDSKLIVRKKVGRTNFVVLNQATLRIVQKWINQYKTDWGSVNASLENYISRMKE